METHGCSGAKFTWILIKYIVETQKKETFYVVILHDLFGEEDLCLIVYELLGHLDHKIQGFYSKRLNIFAYFHDSSICAVWVMPSIYCEQCFDCVWWIQTLHVHQKFSQLFSLSELHHNFIFHWTSLSSVPPSWKIHSIIVHNLVDDDEACLQRDVQYQCRRARTLE